MTNNFFKRADLLGISVYDLINNYIFIFTSNGNFYGLASHEDIDKYMISHNKHSNSIVLIDMTEVVNNMHVLKYDYLEQLLED